MRNDEEGGTVTAERKPRAIPLVEAELKAARIKHAELQQLAEAYWGERQAAITARELAVLMHKANPVTAGLPFNPSAFPGGLVIPPESTAMTDSYHKIHETITYLERELAAARKAAAF